MKPSFPAKIIISSICLLFFIFVFVNIFDLSVLSGNKNYDQSVKNTYTESIVLAPRGEIFDAKGRLLAENEVKREIVIGIEGLSVDDFEKINNSIETILGKKIDEFVIEDNKYIINDLSEESFKAFKEELIQYSYHVTFIETSNRIYPSAELFAHVIGYVGKSSQIDLDQGLTVFDIVGKTGVEEFYDSYLRGENGIEASLKRFDGSTQNAQLQSIKNGQDVTLTIDSDWQKKLYELIKNQVDSGESFAGTAMIMKSDTGELLSMVSYPSFDNNLFTGKLDDGKFQDLINDKKSPMLNRAISIKLPPGSTFKPLVAVSALEDEIVDPSTSYFSNGCEMISDTIRFCEADNRSLGDVDMYTAIARSSNLYFCDIGKKYNEKFGEQQGIQYLADSLDKFKIEDLTGVDLHGELKSAMASPEKVTKNNDRLWSVGDMCNTVIGQGYVEVSPIKMLTIAGAYVNNGEILAPYVVSEIKNEEGEIVFENRKKVSTIITTDSKNLELINTSMRLAVNDSDGSGKLLKNLNYDIRLKTGSADASEKFSDGGIVEGAHSWVVGTFNYEDEDYSFVVVLQFGGRGYKSVPIVGNFITCLNDGFAQNCEQY